MIDFIASRFSYALWNEHIYSFLKQTNMNASKFYCIFQAINFANGYVKYEVEIDIARF